MDKQFFMGLVYNASLLLAMLLVFEILLSQFKNIRSTLAQIVAGVVLGFICLAVMSTNWELIPGVIFDTRSVLLGTSGLFFGFVPTVVAMIMAILYRVSLGGSGIYMGIPVILASGSIGLVWRSFRLPNLQKLSWIELYAFGLLIHSVMLLMIVLLPGGVQKEVFVGIWFPILSIYPVATLFLGGLMSNRLRRESVGLSLLESEKKYRFLFDTMSQGITLQDSEGKVVEANRAAMRILGLSEEQLLGKTPYDPRWKMIREDGSIMDPQDTPSNIALHTGKPTENITFGIYIPESDSYRWILVNSVPRFKNGTGDPYQTLTSFVDISDRVEAETQFTESQKNYRDLFENMLSGFAYHQMILDEQNNPINYVILEMNQAYETLTGIKREFALGKNITEVVPGIEENQFDWIREYGKVAMGGPALKIEKYFSPLQKWFYIQAYSPKPGFFATNFIDITQRKQNEEVLRKLNAQILSDKQRMEAILRDMGDAVFVADGNKNIRLVNTAMEKLFNLSEDRMLGRKIEEVMDIYEESSGAKPADLIDSALRDKKPAKTSEVFELKRRTGDSVYVNGVGTPIIDDTKRLVDTVWVLRDVTKEREVDKMKTDFVSLASHQLRTPLTGIKWFVEILEKNALKIPLDRVREYIRKIGSSNDRLIELVNDLISTSRVEAGTLKKEIGVHSIKSLLQQSIDEQGRLFIDKEIEILGLESISEKFEIEADLVQLTQVFGNLFNNAATYSKSGSKIFVNAELIDNQILISVRDQGLGIPPVQQAKMFTKFFRADNVAKTIPGTGLGLYVAKSIVESHCGKIWFESEENVGTTFFVKLPLVQPNRQ